MGAIPDSKIAYVKFPISGALPFARASAQSASSAATLFPPSQDWFASLKKSAARDLSDISAGLLEKYSPASQYANGFVYTPFASTAAFGDRKSAP